MASGSEWPVPPEPYPLRCLRCELRSPDGARRERKMGGAQASQPEMAHTDKVHSFRLNRYVNEFAYRAGWGLTFETRFIRSLCFRSSPGTDRFAFRTGSYYFNVW